MAAGANDPRGKRPARSAPDGPRASSRAEEPVNIFRRLLARFHGRPVTGRPHPAQSEKDAQESARPRAATPAVRGTRATVSGDTAVVSVDLDAFGPEARPLLLQELARGSEFPMFDGSVDHAYAMRSVRSSSECPRCRATTHRQMAHFIYTTETVTRVMLAPAGYFCTACPTVIIDEDVIANGVTEGYRFRAVVGIDHAGKKQPDVFRTWNGQELVYVLDEHGHIVSVTAGERRDQGRLAARAGSREDSAARKRSRRKARRSRRRNRR